MPEEIVRRSRPALGTFVEISAEGAAAAEGVRAAYRAIEAVQKLMSFHDHESELTLLNRVAYEREVEVHPWTGEVLDYAVELYHKTEGLFDISVAPLLVDLAFLPKMSGTPKYQIDAGAIRVRERRYVRFEQPLLLDLGGIAKGFAVDKAIEALVDSGVRAGAVNAGGDLRVFGERERSLFVRNPRAPECLVPLLSMRKGAVATSGAYFSRKKMRGQWVTPIINPRRRKTVNAAFSVSVVAETCLVADAATKILALPTRLTASSVTQAIILHSNGRIVARSL